MFKIYAGIALLVLLSSLSWYAKTQTERAALAEAKVASYSAALEVQNQAVVEFEEKLVAREVARQVAADNAAQWKAKWKEAKHDPIVKKWATIPLPIPVIVRVCDYARCINRGNPKGRFPEGTNTTPSVLTN